MINKKSMIFTISAILLVGVLIASASLVTKTRFSEKTVVAVSRVNTMNDFILSVHQDTERNLMISGYRSIICIQRFVADNGDFINNFNSLFQEVIINGSLNGTVQDLMANATIIDWSSRMNDEASKLNINVVVTPISAVAYMTDPWSMVIEFKATVNVSDYNNLAYWYYNKTFTKSVSITGFEDPLYTVKSSNKVTNIIVKANNSLYVNLTNNDSTILYIHLNNSYYVASNSSPDFLMRFSGNISASPYGIESLVNLIDFSKQGLETDSKSVIDYQYFNDTYSGSDKCDFPGMPSWFRINSNRLNSYNLTSLGESCS